MKKILIILLLISLCSSFNSAFAVELQEFSSDKEFNSWITYYYTSPDSSELYSALKYFCNSTLYSNRVLLPMMSFFAAAYKNNNTALKETYNKISGDNVIREKIIFLDVLWLIDTDTSRELIEKAKNEWGDDASQERIALQEGSTPYDVLTIPIISPQILDMLWGTFFATGNKEAVLRIISVLPLSDEKNPEKVLIGSAARWSLKSNAKQHKQVLIICEEEIEIQEEPVKSMLQQILQNS